MRGLRPPLRDMQDEPVICYCRNCGGEIYAEDAQLCEDCTESDEDQS